MTVVPVVVKVATRAVTGVPYGTVTAMVLFTSSIVPTAPVNPANEYAVIALAEFAATLTVTVYVTVEASPAVTIYATGLVKLFGVALLV
jgi:hypothetical protein